MYAHPWPPIVGELSTHGHQMHFDVHEMGGYNPRKMRDRGHGIWLQNAYFDSCVTSEHVRGLAFCASAGVAQRLPISHRGSTFSHILPWNEQDLVDFKTKRMDAVHSRTRIDDDPGGVGVLGEGARGQTTALYPLRRSWGIKNAEKFQGAFGA
ncbi:hypothetical protein J1614_001649 [Plenodomus biglobosus]|nr:hypothetical protein J1614_001649 [Plenodomus biglobosus]